MFSQTNVTQGPRAEVTGTPKPIGRCSTEALSHTIDAALTVPRVFRVVGITPLSPPRPRTNAPPRSEEQGLAGRVWACLEALLPGDTRCDNPSSRSAPRAHRCTLCYLKKTNVTAAEILWSYAGLPIGGSVHPRIGAPPLLAARLIAVRFLASLLPQHWRYCRLCALQLQLSPVRCPIAAVASRCIRVQQSPIFRSTRFE